MAASRRRTRTDLFFTDLDLGGLKDKANKLGKELDAMHKAQAALLKGSHKSGRSQVTSTINNYNALSGVKSKGKK